MKRNQNPPLHINVKLEQEQVHHRHNQEQTVDESHRSMEEQHDDLYAFLNFDGADNALSLVSPLQFDIKSLMLTPRSSSGKRSTSVKAALARTGRNPSTAAACSMPSPSHFFQSPEAENQEISAKDEQVEETLECEPKEACARSSCPNTTTEGEGQDLNEHDELDMDENSIHENILLKTPPDSLVWPDSNPSPSTKNASGLLADAASTLEEDLRIAPSIGHAEHDSFFSFAHSLSPLAASEEFEHGLLPLRLSPLVSLGRDSDLPRLIPPFPLPKFGDSPLPCTAMTLSIATEAVAKASDIKDVLLMNDTKQTPVKPSQDSQYPQCTPEYMNDTSPFPKIQASTSATPGQGERSKIHRTMKLQFCGSAERSNTKRDMQFINNSLKRKSQMRKRKLETSSPRSLSSHATQTSYPTVTERPRQKPANNVQRKLLQTPSKCASSNSNNNTMRSPLRPLSKSRAENTNVLFNTTSKNGSVTSEIKQEKFKENNTTSQVYCSIDGLRVTNRNNHHSHGTRLNTKSLTLQMDPLATSGGVVPMTTTTPKNSSTSTSSTRKNKKTPKKHFQNLSHHHQNPSNIKSHRQTQGSTTIACSNNTSSSTTSRISTVTTTSGDGIHGEIEHSSTISRLTTPLKTPPPTRIRGGFYSRNLSSSTNSSNKKNSSNFHTTSTSTTFSSRSNSSSSSNNNNNIRSMMISPMEESSSTSGIMKTSTTTTTTTTSTLKENFFLSSSSSSLSSIKSKKAPCNCKKSKCLKLYCECFASGGYCDENCNCIGCANTHATEELRQQAMNLRLEKNPNAFQPKIESSSSIYNNNHEHRHRNDISSISISGTNNDCSIKSNTNTNTNTVIVMHATTGSIDNHGIGINGTGSNNGGLAMKKMHKNGCHCKKSACRKKYCECFQAGVPCGDNCRCMDCKNQPCAYHHHHHHHHLSQQEQHTQEYQQQEEEEVEEEEVGVGVLHQEIQRKFTTHNKSVFPPSLLAVVQPPTQTRRTTRIDRETWTKNFSSPFEVSPRSERERERFRLHQIKQVTISNASLKKKTSSKETPSPTTSIEARIASRDLSLLYTSTKEFSSTCPLLGGEPPAEAAAAAASSSSTPLLPTREEEDSNINTKIYVYPLFGKAFPPLEKQLSGKIFQCLTNADLYNASLVNHLWNRVALGDTVWDHDTYIEVLDML